EPLPLARLVGWWASLSGFCDHVGPRRSATLLGSPPCPRVAGRLLIGGERPAPGPGLVWPRGAPTGANLRVGPAPKRTRSCRESTRPPGVCPEILRGRPRRLTA